MYYVYILRCTDNSLYTGIATDYMRRFNEHKDGNGAKYTRSHKPLRIEAVWEVADKSTALSLECSLKRLTKQQKEQLVSDKLDIGTFFDRDFKRIYV